jgi:hypothetical protein
LAKSGMHDKLTVKDIIVNAMWDENGNKKLSHCTGIMVFGQVSLKNDI